MLSPSSEALTIGYCCKAIIAPRTKNGMKVRRAPLRCSKPDFCLLRRLEMRVKSTSNMQWTCALVRRDSIMRCALMLRIFVSGARSPGVGGGGGARTEAGFEATGGALGPLFPQARKCFFVTPAATAVALTLARTTLCSL